MPSLAMTLTKQVLRLILKKPTSAGAVEAHLKAYEHRRYPQPAPIPISLKAKAIIRKDRVQGRVVYTLTPRTQASDLHIVYTHGGGFVDAFQPAHWWIIAQLMKHTGASVTVPIYPLAPEHTYRQTYAFLEAVYRQLLTTITADRIVLCGDSAGGHLAIGQALHYRGLGLPLPKRIIAFAPVVDLTVSNPEIAEVEPRDIMLSRAMDQPQLRWWAGQEDLKAPLLSPLYADLHGLPPIDVFIGTDDILLPDVRIFHDKVRAAGGQMQLYETPGGFHVFMGATFTPEARQVYRQIARNLGVQRTVKPRLGPALWVAAALLVGAWALCRQRGMRR